jgi:hypothetical protein
MAKPTAAQLEWMREEIGAIGHFNMGTFDACGIGMEGVGAAGVTVPPPFTFAPATVDADQWVKTLLSFGVKRAVLVVSHGCGYNTFPSKTKFPEFQFEYNYTIANSPWKNGAGDVALDFVAACKKYGVRPGFYHGAMNNAFLNVVNGHVQPRQRGEWTPVITQDQYTQILLANLRQLWTDYGELAEVWFDGARCSVLNRCLHSRSAVEFHDVKGVEALPNVRSNTMPRRCPLSYNVIINCDATLKGYPPGTADLITALQQELQPNSVGFQGPGKNVIRWAGTEGGYVGEPFWSAAASSSAAGAGSPWGAVWSPGECDTCFQSSSCSSGVDGEQSTTAAGASPLASNLPFNASAPYQGCWFYRVWCSFFD